jgi:DNA-binding transcriptional LysR family regulator
MESHQLRVFLAVAEEASFTKAADRLHVVQSAVSASVRAMERELGTQLFDRSTRHVALTDAGRALLPEARNVVSALTLAADAIQQVAGGTRGSVKVGIMHSSVMRPFNIARLLAALAARSPGIEVTVQHCGGSQQAADLVRAGQLDVAFVSLVGDRHPGIRLIPLATEPIVLACRADHRLATSRAVELGDLVNERFVEPPEGWGTRLATDQAFIAARLVRTVRYEVNDTLSLLDFVREGVALALVPASLVGASSEIVKVPIRGVSLTFDTYLAYPDGKRLTAATQALMDGVEALLSLDEPGRF